MSESRKWAAEDILGKEQHPDNPLKDHRTIHVYYRKWWLAGQDKPEEDGLWTAICEETQTMGHGDTAKLAIENMLYFNKHIRERKVKTAERWAEFKKTGKLRNYDYVKVKDTCPGEEYRGQFGTIYNLGGDGPLDDYLIVSVRMLLRNPAKPEKSLGCNRYVEDHIHIKHLEFIEPKYSSTQALLDFELTEPENNG